MYANYHTHLFFDVMKHSHLVASIIHTAHWSVSSILPLLPLLKDQIPSTRPKMFTFSPRARDQVLHPCKLKIYLNVSGWQTELF